MNRDLADRLREVLQRHDVPADVVDDAVREDDLDAAMAVLAESGVSSAVVDEVRRGVAGNASAAGAAVAEYLRSAPSDVLDDLRAVVQTADSGASALGRLLSGLEGPLADRLLWPADVKGPTAPKATEAGRRGRIESDDAVERGQGDYRSAIADAQQRTNAAHQRIREARAAFLATLQGLSPELGRPGGLQAGGEGHRDGRIDVAVDEFGEDTADFIGFGGQDIPASQWRLTTQPNSRDNLGGFASADRLADRAARTSVSVEADPAGGAIVSPGGDQQLVLPRYRPGDERDPLGMTPDQVASIQRRLVMTGLLDGDAIIRRGFFGPAEVQAYREVLAYANQAGIDANRAINEMAADREDTIATAIREARESFKPDLSGFEMPDEATLRQNTRNLMEEVLNRPVTDLEMRELLGNQKAWYDEALGIYADTQRQDFEAQIAQAEVGELQNLPSSLRTPEDQAAIDAAGGGAIERGPTQTIDVQARLREMFDRRFADEKALDQEGEQVRQNQGRNSAVMGSVLSRLGGAL